MALTVRQQREVAEQVRDLQNALGHLLRVLDSAAAWRNRIKLDAQSQLDALMTPAEFTTFRGRVGTVRDLLQTRLDTWQGAGAEAEGEAGE